MPRQSYRHKGNKHRKHRKTYKQQKGGSGHIYTLPIELLYNTLYDLANELFDLRSKCVSTCMQKLCSPSSDPIACDQAKTMMYYNNVYEIANVCNMQLVRMTDPTGAQCQKASPAANCVCELYMKKYKEFERIIADLDIFISNYHIDTPVKQYIQSIRQVAQSIRTLFDNFNIGIQLRTVPPEFKTKSINDIMQTSEFKNALRSAVTVVPRPASAPSRLEISPSPRVASAPIQVLTQPTKTESRKAFMPKTIARRHMFTPSASTSNMTASTRVFNSLTQMNN